MPIFPVTNEAICQGLPTLASGYPVYSPQSKTPSATDTTAETVTITGHGWVTGTMITPLSTVGGLTADTIYYINAADANTVSFHTTYANAAAGSSKVNLTANITQELRPFGITSGTLYFAPHRGGKISLYNGSQWVLHSFSQLSLALSGLTDGLLYDQFIYDNAGTLTLELTAWTNSTTRATELTTQNGILVKSGATTRRYVGTGVATGTGTIEQVWAPPSGTTIKIHQWSYYQRQLQPVSLIITGSEHTYGTASWRSFENSANHRANILQGVAEDGIYLGGSCSTYVTGGTPANFSLGFGYDSTTVLALGQRVNYSTNPATSQNSGHPCCDLEAPARLGLHYYQLIENSFNGVTVNVEHSTANYKHGITGRVWC